MNYPPFVMAFAEASNFSQVWNQGRSGGGGGIRKFPIFKIISSSFNLVSLKFTTLSPYLLYTTTQPLYDMTKRRKLQRWKSHQPIILQKYVSHFHR